jgi:hypothetical protein
MYKEQIQVQVFFFLFPIFLKLTIIIQDAVKYATNFIM